MVSIDVISRVVFCKIKGIVRDKAKSVRDKARLYSIESSIIRDATQKQFWAVDSES